MTLEQFKIKLKEIAKYFKIATNFIKIAFKEDWSLGINLFLLVLFSFWEQQRLITGGLLLISLGIKRFFIEGIIKKKPLKIFFGTLMVYYGIIALITHWMLPTNLDMYLFFVIIIFICSIIIYSFFLKSFNNFTNIFAFVILIYFAMVATMSTNSILIHLQDVGFTGIYFYLGLISLLLLSLLSYFAIFKLLFHSVEKVIPCKLFNDYFYFALAIALFTLILGYFYLQNFSSPEDTLKDFFIILSISFITSFGGVASIKSLSN